ncbi:hypothetical protein VSVS12_01468 [Vibrio scophthalmi]|uniref:Uncharacterized protein n=1 Tax=Vibrio scophthalmi TaxID=45658 RepID=A0A1B1NNJ7_9VIBR|nr:hypothetical protein VSVS12_01468 [Vibrio scophthalmi]ANU36170.1 hypothetical protein VSVS05_01043 [Vibrio scophthalmi]
MFEFSHTEPLRIDPLHSLLPTLSFILIQGKSHNFPNEDKACDTRVVL